MTEKEERIAKMATVINLNRCSSYQVAKALIEAGYGDVKKAIEEFAGELKKELSKLTVYEAGNTDIQCWDISSIEKIIRRLLCSNLKIL